MSQVRLRAIQKWGAVTKVQVSLRPLLISDLDFSLPKQPSLTHSGYFFLAGAALMGNPLRRNAAPRRCLPNQ
jgi:hypothetical protein